MKEKLRFEKIKCTCEMCKKEDCIVAERSKHPLESYGIACCTSCGYWEDNSSDGFLTKEQIQELDIIDMSEKSEYISTTGRCKNCELEGTLLEQDEKLFSNYGSFDLYAITYCSNCGYWYNNVDEGFFTKEEIEEL